MGTLAARAVTFTLVLALAAPLAACGRRRVEQAPAAQPSGAQQLSAGGSYAPAPGPAIVAGPQLNLGQDLFCQFGNVRLQVLANGQFWVDGSFVGTFTPDGGFYNVEGIEIGRLHPNGRMTYAGTVQDAGLDGGRIISPEGTIAFVDAGGYFRVVGAQVPPAAVMGMSGAHVRTFLFAFSMFAALLDTAQRMGY